MGPKESSAAEMVLYKLSTETIDDEKKNYRTLNYCRHAGTRATIMLRVTATTISILVRVRFL